MLQNRYKTMNGGGGVSVSATPDSLRRTPEPLEAAPPPRRSVSVNHLARQLQNHTRVSPQVMVTPSKQFNHNNNRPFSYLSPQVTEHLVNASDEDEGLEIDAAYKPRQVSFSNKYRQVLFNEDDYPKTRYENDLPIRNSYEDEFPKKRYDDDYPKKKLDEDLTPKKRYEEDLTPKKRYDDDPPRKKYEFGQRVNLSSHQRYASDHNSRDVVDSGIENDHPKHRTRTSERSERTSSRVSERTPSRVSTLRRETGRESPAMPSARLVQQASKSSSPRRRSLSILDEDTQVNDQDNNRTKTLEKDKKKRKLRLKNFFIRDKNKNNEEPKEVKSSTLKRPVIRTKSAHDPSDTDQASCDELKPLPQQSRSSGQRRPVKRSSSMHTTHAPPPAPSSRRSASRSGSSVLDAPKLSWFKTVDRFTFRTKKPQPAPQQQHQSSSSSSNGKVDNLHHHEAPPRRFRRPFDDTDPESAPEPATLERRHFKPRHQKPSSGSSSGGPSGARRGVQQRQNRLANSSEESENDPKPMYLHNAAVGDIPGRFGPRRTVSREELAAHKPTKHLSRSFSVLAPWRPSRYQGNPEIYYQNEGSERYHTKPPRGPSNRMTASIESLGGSGSSLERGRTPKYKSRTNVNGL
ncbi:serine/arginine repetitive matrix protein 1-like [Neocloeon triangulifer]|uniref:serine/arginine repetitive matrix protein 1-like n=1 Tax=Neocloeon triangulifer TaxID=2078957 RepID=UPI00286F1824|nr:serine/arginine repetitive matrix protein 1-like [Neocloeon triangulifer]